MKGKFRDHNLPRHVSKSIRPRFSEYSSIRQANTAYKIQQESVMYLCSADNSNIIKYEYSKSSKCSGEYETSIVTRNPNDFQCNDKEICSYIIVKIHNQYNVDPNDWRRWYSSTWIINYCNNGHLYSCHDNTGYIENIYNNTNCNGLPSDIISYSADQYIDENKNGFYDIYCNQPDPVSAIMTIPDRMGLTEYAKTIIPAIETAICLDGRRDGEHSEIGDKMVNYCFAGYDVNGKPIYIGKYAEIRWTKKIGDSYGDSYGIFLKMNQETEEWPVAYCFGNSNDIRVCSKNWYVDYGNNGRYYIDENMEIIQCQCNQNIVDDKFGFIPPRPTPPTPTENTDKRTTEIIETTRNTKQYENGVHVQCCCHIHIAAVIAFIVCYIFG